MEVRSLFGLNSETHDGPTHGPTDRPTDRPTDGRTDGRTDGQTHLEMLNGLHEQLWVQGRTFLFDLCLRLWFIAPFGSWVQGRSCPKSATKSIGERLLKNALMGYMNNCLVPQIVVQCAIASMRHLSHRSKGEVFQKACYPFSLADFGRVISDPGKREGLI